jgi:hypothetical protein
MQPIQSQSNEDLEDLANDVIRVELRLSNLEAWGAPHDNPP